MVSVFSFAKQSRYFFFVFTKQLIIIAVAALFGAFIGSQRLTKWLLHRSSNSHNSFARELLLDSQTEKTNLHLPKGKKGKGIN